jgi:aspartate racemase
MHRLTQLRPLSSLNTTIHRPVRYFTISLSSKMRTLGLLGGMTYHATLIYYEQINRHIQVTLGGSHSASLILRSFDFGSDIGPLFTSHQWDKASQKLVTAAKSLRDAGAEAIVLCVNTGHKVADDIERECGLPLLHIIDFSGEAIKAKGLKRVALLGTKPVMEDDFIVGRLAKKYDLDVMIPKPSDRQAIHDVIFGDLGQKIVTEQTRNLFLDVVAEMKSQGAEGIVLACTELQFVIKPEDTDLALFETVELHAKGAANWALQS